MSTAVRLGWHDGSSEFVRECHVHGVQGSRLLLATGEPGAGVDAEVIREVPLSGLTTAETVTQDDADDDSDGGSWRMSF